MRPIPKKMLQEILADPFYKECARPEKSECDGRVTLEHVWIYAGKQINEKWAIIPLCWFHHLGAGLIKQYNQWISLQRATPEELAKYPRVSWEQKINYLKKIYA